jgi:hypothetical protein
MAVLTGNIRDWIAIGHPGAFATVGADRLPAAARVWVARVHPTNDIIEVGVARSAAAPLLRNLTTNPQGALNLAAPVTYRSVQFKGPCVASSEPLDTNYSRAWLDAVDAQMQAIGLPPGSPTVMLGRYGESLDLATFSLQVVSVFDQSPRRGAGAPL